MTVRLTGFPVTRIDALTTPRAGRRRPFGFGGISRATSRPRRTTETEWPDETSSRRALNLLRASATLTVFILWLLLYNDIVQPPLSPSSSGRPLPRLRRF